MSVTMRLARLYVRFVVGCLTEASVRRKLARPYPPPAPVTGGLRRRAAVREDTVQGQRVYTLTPRRRRSAWHFIYTHGGAYVNPLRREHWDIIGALMDATGATVTVPIYPLAPEHDHTAAHAELEQVYLDVLARAPADHVVLCGDSAGGGLALAQALRGRDRGQALPAHVVLFAPWLDLTLADPRAKELDSRDLMQKVEPLRQAGRHWAGSADPRSPLLSPLYGDFRGLPPIQVYVGTDDVFLPDARTLRDRVKAAGGTIQLHETDGGFHVFVGATFTPEARRVFRQIAAALGT